jgi:hypothetical protein
MTTSNDLGKRLSELEPIDPALRGKYEEALTGLFERKLSGPMKVFVAAVGLMSLGIAIFLASQVILHPELPLLAHVGFVAGVLFSLAWGALCGWTLYRGAWYVKIQPTAMGALAWVFAVLLETLFLMLAPMAPDPYLWTVAILAGMVILIGAGVQMLGTRMQQTELAMRESFLRLEYRLAEVTEELAKRHGD